MALLSFAGSPHGGTQKLLPEWQSEPQITPTTIIDHSIVGSGLGAFLYFRDQTSLESHFIVLKSGMIWQLMDTGRQADANYRANAFALSIETEDNGNPNTDPWTAAQLASLSWLHEKLRAVHSTIPRKRCASEAGGGLGYHSLFGAPSDWTPVAGKTCPGKPVRVQQWNTVLVPAFLGGAPVEEDDLPYTKEELEDIVLSMVRKGIVTRHGLTVDTGSLFSKVEDIQRDTDAQADDEAKILAAIAAEGSMTDAQVQQLATLLASKLPAPQTSQLLDALSERLAT